MNVIFLDMDGVLNSMEAINNWIKKNGPINKDEDNRKEYKKYFYEDRPEGYMINPINRHIFKQMYRQIPNCKIVWSSSWRKGLRDSKVFIEGLYNQCKLPENSFLSYTPIINGERHIEIESWLNLYGEQNNVDKAAIIDDDYDAEILGGRWNGIPVKFFQTNYLWGLTDFIAQKLVNYFKE